MKLQEMRDKVLAEMEHIPRHPKPAQSPLRSLYFMSRMHSLGKHAKEEQNALQVLLGCIDILKMENLGLKFHYDEEFFND